ncbi:MAG: type II toxin-antitoxin system VapC family toxin [Candidatus Jordarchaeum sp.]|uniref:type II toxin-antitoxin system VapC family toxin n=1 Tax=Candidatus Jordarchaeum sp. TaxID=2823881 RepID=UPI0040494EAF
MEKVEAVKIICVDTDVIVDYLRGREPGRSAFTKWRKKAETSITSITAFELLLGANLSSKRERRITEVENLLDQQNVLIFTRESAKKAAEKGAELRAKGAPIEIRDLFNASMCLIKKMPLLTRNIAHYERIKELKVLTP